MMARILTLRKRVLGIEDADTIKGLDEDFEKNDQPG